MDVCRCTRAVVTLREVVMFTVTMGRSLAVLSVAAAVFASSGRAQVIVSGAGDGTGHATVNRLTRREVTIPDDSVRSYLARFEPGVLDDPSGDANMVTMVLDNDGTYIRSSSRHAKIMQAVPGRVMMITGDSVRSIEAGGNRLIAINGDSARAVTLGVGSGVLSVNGDGPRVVTLTTSGDAGAALGSVIALRRADGDGLPGMIGGVSADEIGGIATKHYPAGELGKGPIFVTFIYLK